MGKSTDVSTHYEKMKQKKARILGWVYRPLGILLFFLILIRADYDGIFQTLSLISIPLFLLALVIAYLLQVSRALKWNYILAAIQKPLPFLAALKYYLIGISMGSLSPLNVGEFVKVFPLQTKGISFKESVASIILDKLSDIIILVIIAVPGVLWIYGIIDTSLLFLVVASLAFTSLFLWIVFREGLAFFVEKSMKLMNIQKPADFIEPRCRTMKPGIFIHVFVFSSLCWAISFLSTYFIAMSLSLNLTTFQVIIFASIYTLVGLLPVSIMGIGTRDASLILLFGLFGLSKEQAIAYSSLILLIGLLIVLPSLLLLLFDGTPKNE